MSPGTAARTAPTMPPPMVYQATAFHVAPPQPARNTRSATRENTQSPMGSGIRIGWSGCRATLAGVDMGPR